MAYSSTEPFKYEFDPNFDFVLEEKANVFVALRKVKWGESNEFKVDIRKYISTDHGEQMKKGCTFMSEDGVDELAKVLLEQGYGRPDEIVNAICNSRPDIATGIVKNMSGQVDVDKVVSDTVDQVTQEYYDIREVIG